MLKDLEQLRSQAKPSAAFASSPQIQRAVEVLVELGVLIFLFEIFLILAVVATEVFSDPRTIDDVIEETAEGTTSGVWIPLHKL